LGVEVCDRRREARDNGVLLHELFDVEVEAIKKSSFSCVLSTFLSQSDKLLTVLENDYISNVTKYLVNI